MSDRIISNLVGLLSKRPIDKAGQGFQTGAKAVANGQAGTSETLQALNVPAEALAEAATDAQLSYEAHHSFCSAKENFLATNQGISMEKL